MSRCRKEPLRPLTQQERQALEKLARSGSERADVVARSRQVLAVSYQDAAARAGRRCAEAVSKLVTRFNREGLAALEPHGRGGPKVRYGAQAQQRILAEARRTPDPEQDGTASWSLMTLRRALRRAPDGLPAVSTYTIGQVLHASGYRWLAARSWCETGKAVRKRRAGTVVVTDPDAEAKKISSSGRIARASSSAWRYGHKMRPGLIRRAPCRGKAGLKMGRPSANPMNTCATALPSC